jgi:hypothetical protein
MSFRPNAWLSACVVALGLWVWANSTPVVAEPATSPESFVHDIRPLLQQYCFPCHSSEKHKGDFDMERFSTVALVKREPKVWQNVAEKLAENEMPPEGKPQPTKSEKERISAWTQSVLDQIAEEHAGDPGPVVLRRLSNAEYTYTVRDLTGVDSLEPAREFPVDGAAGEGFMNTGQALVMSPALLTKYLDAGKEIASHLVLLPDGIRFSAKTTRRDWTEEILTQIRQFYRQFTDPSGGEKVNLQGIVFETNEGGRLPLEKYLAATLAEREALSSRQKTFEAVAHERGLNARYLTELFKMLTSLDRSPLLDGVREHWRAASPEQAAALAAEIEQWQKALWKFNTVGHIGKAGGPKSWLEPVDPLLSKQEFRLKPAPANGGQDITLYLVASDAGEGKTNDWLVWQQPRLVAPGRPDLLLRDVRELCRDLGERRGQLFASAASALAAAAEAGGREGAPDLAALAQRQHIDRELLSAWFDYLGIGPKAAVTINSYFTNQLTNTSGYDFIRGWGSSDTPLLVANSSDQHVRIPGNMKPHSVAVHPSPKLQAAVGWSSPIAGIFTVDASVTRAHPECGSGITWSLDLRRGATRQRLAAGTAQGGKETKVGPFAELALQPGDLVSILIGPRDGNHACDLTAVDLTLTSAGDNSHTWNLAAEVSPDVLAANPHPDSLGNPGVWHFYTEPDNGGAEIGPVIPAGSLLARWQSAPDAQRKQELAVAIQHLLTSGPPPTDDTPDTRLYHQLSSLNGPLLRGAPGRTVAHSARPTTTTIAGYDPEWGLDPVLFGHHPNGQAVDPASLCVQAPSIIEIRLPADLVSGLEFVTSGALEPTSGAEGRVQLQVLTSKPDPRSGLVPSGVTESQASGPWTSDNRRMSHSTPVVVNDGSQARKRFESAFNEFRRWFPAALCYAKIVPVDEVITLTLFYREDDQLARLMLDEGQNAQLDRLWDQLHYVSQDALTMVDAFEQLWQYATQDADPKVFEPMRKPILEHAAAFRQRLVDTEPTHLNALLELANRAYRRPVADVEKDELRGLYAKLRHEELPHDQALRLVLARLLVSPPFLYRVETPGPGLAQAPLNDWELANRLSYFLWSSLPDADLAAAAAAGTLHRPEILESQTRRMLADPRVRRLAIEFACQWLHLHDFDTVDEKSELHFPTFGGLRAAMYEECILFFTDLFQRDGSLLEILDTDHTFLNESLAKHYGIPRVTGDQFRRVDGIKEFNRGGVLADAAILSKQAGASRTSPILRGNWVAEVLLGDKLPKPPKEVPRLPEDEATENLTVRQLTEKHSTDPRCSVCHIRIDAFGYALEGFDAIGRRRDHDLGNRAVDSHARLKDGTEFDDLAGLRDYLVDRRRDDFVRQFCRKLLGYALGRSVQLSDEPLLADLRTRLPMDGYRMGRLVQAIVQSRQFREIRGQEVAADN